MKLPHITIKGGRVYRKEPVEAREPLLRTLLEELAARTKKARKSKKAKIKKSKPLKSETLHF